MSDIIEITSSDEEDASDASKKSTNASSKVGSGLKRSVSENAPMEKKRVKTNHVSNTVSHPFISQLPAKRPQSETVMVYDPKVRSVVYQKPTTQLKIADVRSVGVTDKDPLSLPAVNKTLPEVAIIPLKPTSSGKSGVNSRVTPASPSTSVPSTSSTNHNGYTTTPEITIRSVTKINSPVPGSSRTSSTSSPGGASSTASTIDAPPPPPPKKEPPEMNVCFKDLLDVCKSADQSKEMDLITKKLVKYYYGVHPDFVNSVSFKKTVEKGRDDIKSQPAQVFWLLKTIVDELKIRQGGVMMAEDGEIVTENDEDVTPSDPKLNKKLYKLNRALYITQKQIDKLREADSNWEEENNSSYLKIARYERRAVQIYAKICELTGESTNANRRVKKPIRFNATKYTEFNKALQSLYNKTHNFPDFYDVLKVLEYCNNQYAYGLKGDGLKTVAQAAFQELGEKLQARRKFEEYESLTYYTSIAGDDPAENDKELAKKLEENKKFHTRIDEVINKYAEGRHIELEEPLIGSNKTRNRLKSDTGSHDSGNDDGDNPPELLNGSNPTTPLQTNDIPKTSPSPSIEIVTKMEMEPDLLSLDDVALLTPSRSMSDLTLNETVS